VGHSCRKPSLSGVGMVIHSTLGDYLFKIKVGSQLPIIIAYYGTISATGVREFRIGFVQSRHSCEFSVLRHSAYDSYYGKPALCRSATNSSRNFWFRSGCVAANFVVENPGSISRISLVISVHFFKK
jgi:hypothetical protein